MILDMDNQNKSKYTKVQRIAAMLGIILLLIMYALTLVFALMKRPGADDLLMASIFCTIAVPVLLFAMIRVAEILAKRGEDIRRESSAKEETAGEASDESDLN